MTTAEQELIQTCGERGIEIDVVDAGFVLLAQKILARDPKHHEAKQVLENFATHLSTGKEPQSFAGFLLREESVNADRA
jgi:hypothetical protein